MGLAIEVREKAIQINLRVVPGSHNMLSELLLNFPG